MRQPAHPKLAEMGHQAGLPPIGDRIPQAEPFRFVTRAVALSESHGVFQLDLPRRGPSYTLRVFPALLYIELLAQSAAAHAALQPGAAQEVEQGALAAVDKLRVYGRPRPGDTVQSKLSQVKVFGALTLWRGQVWGGHRLLAEAELTVARQPAR